jgi:hypothetical protein
MRYGLKAAIIAGAFGLAPGQRMRTAKGGISDYLPGLLFHNTSPVEEAL